MRTLPCHWFFTGKHRQKEKQGITSFMPSSLAPAKTICDNPGLECKPCAISLTLSTGEAAQKEKPTRNSHHMMNMRTETKLITQ